MALGAEARDLVRLMMRQGVVLTGVGMMLFAGVPGTLLGAPVLASLTPALRSARVDPNVAPRLE